MPLNKGTKPTIHIYVLGNEGVFHALQIPRTGFSPLDVVVAY